MWRRRVLDSGPSSTAAAFSDAGEGFVVTVIIPMERGGFQIVGGAAGGDGDDAIPIRAGAVKSFLFRLHFA